MARKGTYLLLPLPLPHFPTEHKYTDICKQWRSVFRDVGLELLKVIFCVLMASQSRSNFVNFYILFRQIPCFKGLLRPPNFTQRAKDFYFHTQNFV